LRNDWVDNLVSKEYKGNSAEISGKLYIYIKKKNFVATNIYRIFWVYNLRLLHFAYALKNKNPWRYK
jgi:hypothetical protein